MTRPYLPVPIDELGPEALAHILIYLWGPNIPEPGDHPGFTLPSDAQRWGVDRLLRIYSKQHMSTDPDVRDRFAARSGGATFQYAGYTVDVLWHRWPRGTERPFVTFRLSTDVGVVRLVSNWCVEGGYAQQLFTNKPDLDLD